VDRELTTAGIDPECVYDLVYSVNEIVTNILVHGYGKEQNESGPVEIELIQNTVSIQMVIRDRASIFDPNEAPVPDISLPLEYRKPGGLGVYLVKEYVNQILHRPLESGGNEVVLVKKLNHGT
ncbi:MAG: ATP-binding protein, partial [Anaerolineae bacterium]|nr:ATP-binding protein [Anaerolineae bacterium]